MSSSSSPLIGALLRIPLQAVWHELGERLAEQGFDDVHPSHFAVFQYPGPDGVSPSELAARLGTTKQAMNHLLRRLETHGYLELAAGRDARSRAIRLTRRGHALIAAIRAIVRTIEQRWAALLGAGEFATLRRLLQELGAKLP